MPRRQLTAFLAVLTAPLACSAFGTPTAAAPVAAERTLCGAAFQIERGDESYQDAFERVNGYYGLGSARVFYPGLPRKWPGKVDVGSRPLTVSFKIPPGDVLAGEHDDYMREWFGNAPAGQDIYWTYFHEPEDNIERGQFTEREYRAAWKRLGKLAGEAGNPRLRATLILMSWSADPDSGRDWRDYYPGAKHIDVLGWDAYNQITGETTTYRSPETIFGDVVSASSEAGKPFGIAETGSALATGDTGRARAEWLDSVADYLTRNEALFVQYFDIDYTEHGHSDYRLRDEMSKAAWRRFCER